MEIPPFEGFDPANLEVNRQRIVVFGLIRDFSKLASSVLADF